MRFKISLMFVACVLLLSSCKKDKDPAIGVGTLLNNNILLNVFSGSATQLYSMSADGSSLTQLTHFDAHTFLGTASWSPDHSKILYTANNYIYIMNADGTNPVELSDNNTISYNPNLSPNGKKILYLTRFLAPDPTYGTTAVEQLAVMNSNGTGKTQITNFYTSAYNYLDLSCPIWSPDGSKIAFIGNPNIGNSGMGVYTVNPDGSGLTLVLRSTNSLKNICYSPDGSTLLLQILSSNLSANGLYTCNASDGTNLKMLFPTFETNAIISVATPPSYSPDGTQIIAGSFKDTPTTGDTYIITSNGTIVRKLTNNFNQIVSTAWR